MEAAESQRARFYARSDVSGTCFRDAMFAIAGLILCIEPMVAEIPQDPCISDKGDVVNLAQLTALAPGSLRSALHFSRASWFTACKTRCRIDLLPSRHHVKVRKTPPFAARCA